MFRDPFVVGCWPTLVARLDAEGVVLGWSASEPELAGLADVGGLLAAWEDPQRTHRVGQALVRLAAVDGGADDDALVLLLHLLSGVVWRLVGQLGDLSPDVPAIVLAELTCRLRSYPWRTRRGGLVRAVEKDTRRAVLAELRPSDRCFPERVERLTVDGRLPEIAGNLSPGEDDVALADLLGWAADAGVAEADLVLLVDSECARGRRGVRADERVARRHGICRRTLYRRRERTLAALRAVAADYLAAVC